MYYSHTNRNVLDLGVLFGDINLCIGHFKGAAWVHEYDSMVHEPFIKVQDILFVDQPSQHIHFQLPIIVCESTPPYKVRKFDHIWKSTADQLNLLGPMVYHYY